MQTKRMETPVDDTAWRSPGAKVRPGLLAGQIAALALASLVGSPPTLSAEGQSDNSAIERSVTISWPENTLESQIVAGAEAIAGAYRPRPEHIFRQAGRLCIAVPAASAQHYFRLVPGTQFVDDFLDPEPPFVERGAWRPIWDSAQATFLVTNGVLQASWTGVPGADNLNLFGAKPPGPDVVVGNFLASVDILAWETTDTPSSAILIVARCIIPVGYGGGVLLNIEGATRTVTPVLSYGGDGTLGEPFDFSQIPPPYRLEYSGLDNHFALRVINLTTQELIQELTWTHSARRWGFMGLGGAAPAGSGSHQLILDNYSVTGTTP